MDEKKKLESIPLSDNTKATDILEKVTSFFETENLSWNNLCGCCTNGAPAMMGSRSRFQVNVKNRSQQNEFLR